MNGYLAVITCNFDDVPIAFRLKGTRTTFTQSVEGLYWHAMRKCVEADKLKRKPVIKRGVL